MPYQRSQVTLTLATCVALWSACARDKPRDSSEGLEPPERSSEFRREQYRQIDAWLTGEIARAPNVRAKYWKLDFSSAEAYDRSVERYRREWAELIGLPPDYRGPFREQRRLVSVTSAYRVERIWFDAWDGVQVYGILLTPRRLLRRVPAVICIHGVGDSPELTAGMLDAPDDEEFARRLAERGVVTFSPYIIERYSEANQPREGPEAWGRDILHRKALLVGRTLVGLEVRKLLRSLDYLQAQPEVDPDRIGMIGFSKGGQYTLAAAPLDSRIKATVVSGWFNDRAKKNSVARNQPEGMFFITTPNREEYYLPDLLNRFGDAELAWMIAPRRFLVENGYGDGAVLIRDARREFARVKEVYARLGLADRAVFSGFDSHGTHRFGGAESLRFLETWLRR